MHIATHMRTLKSQLDLASADYRAGKLDWSHLISLEHQVKALLEVSRGTSFENQVLCKLALVRSLETLASRQAGLTPANVDQGSRSRLEMVDIAANPAAA